MYLILLVVFFRDSLEIHHLPFQFNMYVLNLLIEHIKYIHLQDYLLILHLKCLKRIHQFLLMMLLKNYQKMNILWHILKTKHSSQNIHPYLLQHDSMIFIIITILLLFLLFLNCFSEYCELSKFILYIS